MTFALIIIAVIVCIAVLSALGGRRRSGRASRDNGGDGSFFLFTSNVSGETGSHHGGDAGSCHGGDAGGFGGDCGGGHH
jgi:hypothetical protein